MLTDSKAIEIYGMKGSWGLLMDARPGSTLRGLSVPVSKLFGVSSRAIRDIWNRKTWSYATKELWRLESTSQAQSGSGVTVFKVINSIEKRNIG